MTLVLLHGFTHTGASWRPAAEALPRGYRALAPDLRGHGRAADRRPVDLSGVLEDVRAAVPERCVLAGYSMGGRIALHVALDPDLGRRVERLVLVGASPGIADPAEREARRRADEALARRAEAMTIEQFAEHWAAAAPVLADQPASVREWIAEDRRRNTTAGLAAALRGLGTAALPSLWDRLGEVDVPVMLVVGERDEKFRGIAEEMGARLPDAELVVVPGVGHAVHLEAPRAVAAALSARTS